MYIINCTFFFLLLLFKRLGDIAPSRRGRIPRRRRRHSFHTNASAIYADDDKARRAENADARTARRGALCVSAVYRIFSTRPVVCPLRARHIVQNSRPPRILLLRTYVSDHRFVDSFSPPPSPSAAAVLSQPILGPARNIIFHFTRAPDH